MYLLEWQHWSMNFLIWSTTLDSKPQNLSDNTDLWASQSDQQVWTIGTGNLNDNTGLYVPYNLSDKPWLWTLKYKCQQWTMMLTIWLTAYDYTMYLKILVTKLNYEPHNLSDNTGLWTSQSDCQQWTMNLTIWGTTLDYVPSNLIDNIVLWVSQSYWTLNSTRLTALYCNWQHWIINLTIWVTVTALNNEPHNLSNNTA